jgi:FAD-dependent oxidoreductase family protein
MTFLERASAVALVAQPAEHGQRRIGSVADLQSTCLSVAHISNGCFRLHPIEWNVGEAAGALAAHAANGRSTPHAMHACTAELTEYQRLLTKVGAPCPGRTHPNRRPTNG